MPNQSDEFAVAVLEAALEHAKGRLEPEVVLCPVCEAPRVTGHPDPLRDYAAHAQCNQILADMEAAVG